MDTIYLVTWGEYDSYQVLGAYTVKEDAELVASMIEYASVEDYPLDTEYIDLIRLHPGKRLYTVSMNRASEHILSKANLYQETWPKEETIHQLRDAKYPYRLAVVTWATSEHQAIEISNEIRQRLIDSGEW